MDRKAVNEIKKCFNKNDCRVDRMRGCYVNENKEKISTLHDTFLALEDEDMSKYCEIFRRGLSGRIGKNLFNAEFPLEEEKDGGKQAFLYQLQQSELKDDDLTDEFFDRVIASYNFPGKYLILLVHGVYDIPAKTTDGIFMEDGSEYVYSFLLLSICPVKLLREGLCYDEGAKAFLSRTDDWGLQKPDISFLFPAFNDRNTDLHSVLYYSRNAEERHEEIASDILGVTLPLAEKEQKNAFKAIVEDTLGRGCDFDAVKGISDSVSHLLKEKDQNSEPAVLGKAEVRDLLEKNGAGEEDLAGFDKTFEEAAGGSDVSLSADNLIDTRAMSVTSNELKLQIKSDSAELLETRIIDGEEYLLIPLTDNLEVNGIRVRKSASEKS